MVESKPPRTMPPPFLDRRWVGIVYTTCALILLSLAMLQRTEVFASFTAALVLLLTLVVATPLTARLIGRGREPRLTTLLLLGLDAVAALGLIVLTGGANSPMWVGLLVVSTAAPLLLPNRYSALLLALVWLCYGVLLLVVTPQGAQLETLFAWMLRVAGVAMIALVLQRALSAEEDQRRRSQQRERVLHEFLQLSARLRVSSKPETILEEVARTVQASGDFDCVTLSRIDQKTQTITVTVAIGASGRRLSALEGLSFPWDQLATMLIDKRRVGPNSFRLDTLPFRTIRGEQHLVLPLVSQPENSRGLLTVSCPLDHYEVLTEAQPLLELLANQAAAVLENSDLYGMLEQRVADALENASRSREELALARDQSETLYQIVRSLSRSLDEREVISVGYNLVRQATEAEWGGILLLEPNTGRLAVRTGFEAMRSALPERLYELAGIAVAQRRSVGFADVRSDNRWPRDDQATRALLVVPMQLDSELLGALVLGHSAVQAFSPSHIQLAQAATDQIAVALSKAQLYRYVSEQNERLGHTLGLREEEFSRNQAILNSIGEGVVVSDRLDRVRMINPAAASLLAINADEFTGHLMDELPGAPLGNPVTSPLGYEEITLGSRTLRAHYAPVLTSSGEQLGGVVVYHDVTRDVMADRLKSTFIATASHELRTPLTSIRGYVDLLLLGTIGPLSQAQRDFLKVVKHNVGQLVELIDDILDVSKVEAGEIRLRRLPIDAGEVIYEVAESLYSQFAEKSIALAIDIMPSLPQVMADRQRIRQVLVNLVSNACKYTPSGGTVDIVARADEDELRIDVRDTGVGIAIESQAYIFTPFFRADNPLRDAAGGTGLGLSITKTLIELHGGRIWFDSTDGEGSVFSFALPLHGYEWSEPSWLDETAVHHS